MIESIPVSGSSRLNTPDWSQSPFLVIAPPFPAPLFVADGRQSDTVGTDATTAADGLDIPA
jgi:hypothetical protein